MTAARKQSRPDQGTVWPSRVALLLLALFFCVRSEPIGSRAADPDDPPTAEELSRYREWYKQHGANVTQPSEASTPTPEDIIHFKEWYRLFGAPKPLNSNEVPTANEAARFLEWYRHAGAPLPPIGMAAPPKSTEPPLPPLEESVAPEAKAGVLATPPKLIEPPLTPLEGILAQVGCSSCSTAGGTLGLRGNGVSDAGPAPSGGCACGSGNCVPGRKPCYPCESDNVVGRFLCGVYECICCPDPCYDPKWIPLADSAFFTESARPQTQQRVRWDAGLGLNDPDIAEYFWARADGKGSGPNPGNHANPAGFLGEQSVKYSELSIYTEAALGNIGAFVEMPYRSLDGELVGHAAGFGDMNLGTKTLLFDCELLQIALEFRTYLPIGDVSKGLGTGHVSLEPGLIVGLKLGPETYFQGQVSEWIPIGGDPDYEGALLEYHLSVNQLLCRILPDVPLVGTVEMNGWSFQHGQFTDPVNGPESATGITYLSMGPGLRLFICDKIDFGLGSAFAVTSGHFADQLFRSEFRWRF